MSTANLPLHVRAVLDALTDVERQHTSPENVAAVLRALDVLHPPTTPLGKALQGLHIEGAYVVATPRDGVLAATLRSAIRSAAATAAPSEPAAPVRVGVIGEALLTAHDHIDMRALDISHCKAAQAIRHGIAEYKAAPQPSAKPPGACTDERPCIPCFLGNGACQGAKPAGAGEPMDGPVAEASVYEYCQDDKGEVRGECWNSANVNFKPGFLAARKPGDKIALYTTPAATAGLTDAKPVYQSIPGEDANRIAVLLDRVIRARVLPDAENKRVHLARRIACRHTIDGDAPLATPSAPVKAEPDFQQLDGLLNALRLIRDRQPWEGHRSTMNAAIDRLAVVASKLAHGDDTPAKAEPPDLLRVATEMAYQLRMVPRGEVVPIQFLTVLKQQYLAAHATDAALASATQARKEGEA